MYVSLSASCNQPLKVFRFSGQVKKQKQHNQQKNAGDGFCFSFFHLFSLQMMRIAAAEAERRQGTRVEEEAVRDITGQLKHTTLCYCTQKAAQSALTV